MVFILILCRPSKHHCVSIDHSLQILTKLQDLPPPQSSKPIEYLGQNVQRELTTHSTQPDLEPPFLSTPPPTISQSLAPSHPIPSHPLSTKLEHPPTAMPSSQTSTPSHPSHPSIPHHSDPTIHPLPLHPPPSETWRRAWWQASVRKAAPGI